MLGPKIKLIFVAVHKLRHPNWGLGGNRNNPQEAYNGVLNRLLQVAHPNPCVLLTKLVAELDNVNYLIQKSKKGKKVIERRTKYQILFEEKENLKQKYHKNLISRKEYLKSMGHKLRKLEKEAMRNIPDANNDKEEQSGLRMRIVRTMENDILRVQDISEKVLQMISQEYRLIILMLIGLWVLDLHL